MNQRLDSDEATQVANGQRLLDQRIENAKNELNRLVVLREAYPSLPDGAQLAIVQLVYRGMR